MSSKSDRKKIVSKENNDGYTRDRMEDIGKTKDHDTAGEKTPIT